MTAVIGSYRESESCRRAARYVHAAMDCAEERCGVLEDPALMPASLKIEIDALRTAALTLERRMERAAEAPAVRVQRSFLDDGAGT